MKTQTNNNNFQYELGLNHVLKISNVLSKQIKKELNFSKVVLGFLA